MNNEPLVSLGATLHVGSDCYPFTIVRVSDSGKTFWMQEDVYRRTDKNGFSESQEYEYQSNTLAPLVEVRRAKNGGWYTGGGMRNGSYVHVGTRRAYWDPSF